MKKYLLAIALIIPFSGFGQGFKPENKVPLDPAVRYGKLKNGMTYYIRHNEEPKDRASFYIIQNVGAILEEDNQNGLAHFLEHMAFNGTENFPKNGIIDYLEKYGVAFGRNINAGTGIDHTAYNISNVPVNHQPLLDSCLLILHDWSNYLLLNTDDIDEERGVIAEEWRTRRDANFRLRNKLAPYIYNGSKYSKRDVIGDLEVIKNFDPDVIRKFYYDWYRTDLQAIAVVGDIDAEKMEKQIIDMFSEISAVKNPKERINFDIPDNVEPIIGIATDPESQQTIVQMMIKHDAVKADKKNNSYLRNNIVNSLYSSMINGRLGELIQKENPPFVFGAISYSPFTRTKDIYMLACMTKNDGIIAGLNAVLLENERIIRHGFTMSELEREKVNYLRNIESRYKERNKIRNDTYIGQYLGHFLNADPAPGIEFTYEFTNMLMPGISLEELNALAKKYYTEENMVVSIMAPENAKDLIPDKETIIKTINNIKNIDLEPYEDEASDYPLITEIPEGTKVVETKELEEFDAVEWTLGNGLKVVIKSTDFKEDEIIMSAFSKGGLSLVSDKDLPSGSNAAGIINMYGLGEFEAIALNKKLSGKLVSVAPVLNNLYEGFTGNCSPKDFETMLQLVYMYFNNPRFDE
ncbi:insulinase family protein, partial [Bacteroidota bacterium]